MISDILSEAEFKRRLVNWLLENDRGAFLGGSMTREEYIETYRLPDFDYVHTQSVADENGELITLLRSEIRLSDWETKNGREPRKFEFYRVLKTMTDSPEVEPFPMGYIIVL